MFRAQFKMTLKTPSNKTSCQLFLVKLANENSNPQIKINITHGGTQEITKEIK